MMNFYRNGWILLILGLMLMCGGCMGPKGKRAATEFYTLNYDPPARRTEAALPYCISVEPFDAVPPYDSTRMIFSTSPFTLNSYAYHEWIAYPADMVEFIIVRDLQSAGIVQSVFTGDSRFATHRLIGKVSTFCEQDFENDWNALLSVSMTLLRINEPNITKIICFQKTYTAAEPCPRKNPKGFAMAMSAAMAKISDEIIRDIEQSLLSESGYPWRQ